jgi:hypothetical protein
MDTERVDALIKEIKERRAKQYDLTFAAPPGTTDPVFLETARWAAALVEEYDGLLAIVGE